MYRTTLTLLISCLCLLSPTSSGGEVRNGLYLPIDDVLVADLSGAQVTLNGNAVIATPEAAFAVDDVSVTAELLIEGGLTIDVTANVGGPFAKSISLPVATLPAITLGPTIEILPVLQVGAEISGVAEAGMELGAIQRFALNPTISIGASMATTLNEVPDFLSEVAPPVVTGNAMVDLTVEVVTGIAFVVVINGVPVGGPIIDATYGLDIVVEPANDPWWSADAGVSVNASANLAGIPFPPTSLWQSTVDLGQAPGPFVAPPTKRWAYSIDLDSAEDATSIVPLADGSAYIVGNGQSAFNEGWIALLDPTGAIVWERLAATTLGGVSRPMSAVATPDGGLLCGGLAAVNGTARLDKIDSNGNLRWTKKYTDALGGTLHLSNLASRKDGGFVFTGKVTRGGVKIPTVVFVDHRGDVESASEIDVLSESTDAGFEVVLPTADGGVILGGHVVWEDTSVFVDQTISLNNGFLVKVAADGRIAWANIIGNKGHGEILDADLLADGSIVVCGKQNESELAWVATVKANGTLDWSSRIAGDPESLFDRLTTVSAMRDGGFIVGGTSGLAGGADVWLFRLTRRGLPLWHKSIRSGAFDELVDLHALDDGLIACGKTDAAGPNPSGPVGDLWCVRTAVDGMLHFDAASGLDTANDDVSWAPTDLVKQVAMPVPEIIPLVVIQSTDAMQLTPSVANVTDQL